MAQHRFATFLQTIALGHCVIGMLLFMPYWIQLRKRGWVNSTGIDFLEASIAVWFLLFSWPLLRIVVQFWNKSIPIKNRFLELAVFGSLLGISLMPMSGYWAPASTSSNCQMKKR